MKKYSRTQLLAIIARLTRERDEAREAERAALEREKMARRTAMDLLRITGNLEVGK